MPRVKPKIANSQMLAAVVNPNILSPVFINAPAPRKPIPVTIAPINASGFSGLITTAAIARPQEPMATKIKVPKPINLCDFWRSNPNINDKIKVMKNRNKIMPRFMALAINQ